MPSCVFKHCKSCSQKDKKVDGISFHRFPTDSKLRRQWILTVRLNRGEKNWLPSKFSVVCSLHFDDKDAYFTDKGRRLIKKTAQLVRNIRRAGTAPDALAGPSLVFPEMSIKKETDLSTDSDEDTAPLAKSGAIDVRHLKTEPDSSYVLILGNNIAGIKTEDPLCPTDIPQMQHASTMVTRPIQPLNPSLPLQTEKPQTSTPDDFEINDSDLDSIYDTKAERKLKTQMQRNKMLRRKLKSLQQKMRRDDKRYEKLKSKLKDRTFIKENPIANELFISLYLKKTGRTKIEYTHGFREFCFTLYTLSPEAYDFVRESFSDCMPSVRSLKWSARGESEPDMAQQEETIDTS